MHAYLPYFQLITNLQILIFVLCTAKMQKMHHGRHWWWWLHMEENSPLSQYNTCVMSPIRFVKLEDSKNICGDQLIDQLIDYYYCC